MASLGWTLGALGTALGVWCIVRGIRQALVRLSADLELLTHTAPPVHEGRATRPRPTDGSGAAPRR